MSDAHWLTAAEIGATMNHSLSGVPSGVLTFNLDNTPDDSSGGLLGTPSRDSQHLDSMS